MRRDSGGRTELQPLADKSKHDVGYRWEIGCFRGWGRAGGGENLRGYCGIFIIRGWQKFKTDLSKLSALKRGRSWRGRTSNGLKVGQLQGKRAVRNKVKVLSDQVRADLARKNGKLLGFFCFLRKCH